MSNHTYSETTYHAYLWTSLGGTDFLDLRNALLAAPSVPNLRVTTHYDETTGTVFFRWTYRAAASRRDELSAWAEEVGFNFSEPSWSAQRHREFADATFGFRC